MAPASSKKGHHSRTSSLLPSLNSLGSFLASAGGLSSADPRGSTSAITSSSSGGLSTDAELMISHPTPTEWADETSPAKASSQSKSAWHDNSMHPQNLGEEIRFRGQSQRSERSDLSVSKSFIAFPSHARPRTSAPLEPGTPTERSLGSRTSSAASTARDSDSIPARPGHSPEPAASTTSSSADTPATSVRYSPRTAFKDMADEAPIPSPSPPPPSESTVKAGAHLQSGSSSSTRLSQYQYQTLPRSFAASRSPVSYAKALTQDTHHQRSAQGRTSSLSAATGQRAASQLEAALSSEEKTAQRQAGFRARSINSIRGLAAAWVPSRFVPTPQPSSSSSSSSSNGDTSSPDGHSIRRRDGLALASMASTDSTSLIRPSDKDFVKRPVKLDRRRLDKAVSLAVEAAQAAEEDERLWEQKRIKNAAQKASAKSNAVSSRPALIGAWSSSSRSSVDDSRQLTRFGHSEADAGLTSEEEQDDQGDDDDDLGFSLDLYISSLGYLISAISDKEAPGLSRKQRQDIRQRLEEGMSKLGFNAKAELEHAEAMKRELELEREKLQLQRQHEASPIANVIHHHYHTAMPANSLFAEGNFSRAHAAAKASSRGSSSLAGKISSSVLDIGLHIGAGALSALSANLSAIAPRSVRTTSSASVSSSKSGQMEDPKITDLDNDEDLQSLPNAASAQPVDGSSSQPGSGAATPRTAWTRAISQNNKQWELAVAFASTAASALASSLGAVARSDPHGATNSEAAVTRSSTSSGVGPLTHEQQLHLARHGHLEGVPGSAQGAESAEERLILLSASLARALKRSPLPTQLYQLLRQLVSILAAIDAKYSLTEKGTQLAVRETSRAMRFVRRHDLHVKAVRVAWAAAEAAVAALEAYRDEKGWSELHNHQQRIAPDAAYASPTNDAKAPTAAIMDRQSSLETQIDNAEAHILKAATAGNEKEQLRVGRNA